MSAVTSQSDIAVDAGSLVQGTAREAVAHRRVTIICNDTDYFLRHRRITADTLAREGHYVRVATGGAAMPAQAIGKWDYLHLPVERFSFRPGRDMALMLRTVAEVLRHRPDTLHLITLKPIVFAGLAALLARRISGRRLRIVATVPGLGRLMSPRSRMNGRSATFSRQLVERAVRILSSRHDVHFTFETAADHAVWLEKGLVRPEGSTVICGAGVDPKWFYPAEQRAPSGRLRVLFASRLLGAKGLDAFLEAARAFQGNPDVEFLVAGMVEPNDPDGITADELAREPAITFLGERRDMPELLRSVDVVCLPTRYGEGIPRILIEAAATGIPCIASDIDGCLEIVEDGETGVIVPERPMRSAADGIARAVRGYLDDPELLRRHGENGRIKFETGDFAEDKVIAHFLRLIADH